LEFVGTSKQRPTLVIGFAAESQNLEKHAREKLKKKNCDLIIANDIESGKIFGSDETKAIFVSKNKTENLGKISKEKLAELLAINISHHRP
jgi:phosphopantothenoylcysteine decarboxylase/phosphopantothenate--cysteine ligase